jgi:phage-related protein
MSLGITLPVVAGVGLAVKSASDLNETLNKVNVAFGASAKSVLDFGNTSLKSIGLAKGSALDAAALFGDMATSMGLSQSAAADMSVNMVKLGGDLSSFKNISFKEAQTALAGVFTGETESLKRLGIVMTDTELNAFAVAKGIGKTTQEMTQGEKVNLRYAFVMEKTKNAQGDFANTSQGTANQMRMTSERVKELSAQFGERLLPFIGKLLQVGNKFLSWFEKLSPKTQNAIFIFVGLLAVLGPLLIIFGQIAFAIGVLLPVFTAVFAAITAPVLIVIAVIAALAAVIYLIYRNWDTVKNALVVLSNFFVTAWQAIYNAVSSALNSIKNTIVSVWQAIFGFIQPILNFILNLFIIVWGGIFLVVINNLKFIYSNIVLIWQAIWGFIGPILATIQNFIVNTFNYVYAVLSGIFNGILNIARNIWNAIYGVIAGAINNVRNFFGAAGSWLYGAGRNIIQGLVNGISDMAGAVFRKAQEIADGVKNRIKNALGIRSPSKVMMGVGVNVGEGLTIGMKKALPNIKDMALSMANNVQSPMGNLAPQQSAVAATTNNNIYGNITLGDTAAVNTFFNRLDRNGELARKGMATI